MLINSLPGAEGGRCILTFEETDQWLRATWRGFIDSDEAFRGADNYLEQLATIKCPYLLNDNSGLHGPWFDSMEWLMQVWTPQAARMGLRYIAHVVQADTHHDTITDNPRNPAACLFNLQLFDNVPDAEEWLRSCQVTHRAANSESVTK